MATFKIAPETRIGFLALKVQDLDKMTEFYTNILGLRVLKRTNDQVYLGTQVNQEVLLTFRQIDGKTTD
ncbi:VOC family protein [Lactobacillus selangorensis]|nr:VOC family protein [Lactobacillus selangorensis]